ncbi:hypothetical protein CCP1ISM_90022 [Azospirillaceae bacterium]
MRFLPWFYIIIIYLVKSFTIKLRRFFMGDMADYFIELGIEQECNFFRDIDNDDEGENSFIPIKKIITCKFCGKTGFIWEETDQGFRLFKGSVMHDCRSEINDDHDNDDDPKCKPLIGKIQLGRRNPSCIPNNSSYSIVQHTPIVKRQVVKSANYKLNEDGTVIHDWQVAKDLAASNIKPGQYVEITTTTINKEIAWIVKLKFKKSKF